MEVLILGVNTLYMVSACILVVWKERANTYGGQHQAVTDYTEREKNTLE